MESKNRVHFYKEKDGKMVQLVCDNDASLGLVFDAVCEFKSMVMQKIQDSEEKKAEKEESSEPSSTDS